MRMKLRVANKIYKRAQICGYFCLPLPYTDKQVMQALRVTARHSFLTKACRRAGHPTPLDSQFWPRYRGKNYHS